MLLAHHRPRVVELPHPDAPGTRIEFRIVAIGPKQITMRIPGQAKITTHHGGHVEVIAPKEALWIDGVERWASTWLRWASAWFLDARCTGLRDAGSLGWRVHTLEVCADFTGLHFDYEDMKNFHGVSDKETFHSRAHTGGEVDTIRFGRRSTKHSISLESHDKSQQVIAAGGKPATSIYAPIWRAHGWNSTGAVRRVEVRGNRRVLCLHDPRTGEVFDLTDPATLLDQVALGRFWLEGTLRRRLVLPTRTRPCRCPLDPRWEAIQAAAGVSLDTGRLRKLSKEMQELSLREDERRAHRRLCLALADYVTVTEALDQRQRVHAAMELATAVLDPDEFDAALEDKRTDHQRLR